MTFEEKMVLIDAGLAAQEQGNTDLADSFFRQIPLAPELGKGLAEMIGYNNAVSRGVNFEEVEAHYGKNWHEGL